MLDNISNHLLKARKLAAGIRRYGFHQTLFGVRRYLTFMASTATTHYCVTSKDNFTFYFHTDTQLIPTLVLFQELVEPEFEFLRLVLDKDSLFFDIGGGIGTFTVFASKSSQCHVYAFEPVSANADMLARNVVANSAQSDVTIEPLALSNTEGFGKMSIGENLYLSYLADISDSYCDGSVNVTSLDAYCVHHAITHIDVLKADVEGHEEHVLQGASSLLSTGRISAIILEKNKADIGLYKYLAGLGYQFFHYTLDSGLIPLESVSGSSIAYSPSPFHTNVLAIQADKVDSIKAKVQAAD